MTTTAKAYRKQGSKSLSKVNDQKYVGIGRTIVATETRAEGTVRDALVACLGFIPAQLVSVKEGVKEGYAKRLDDLKHEQFANTTTDASRMRVQAIYNRQSEKMAVLESFRLYAGWSKVEQTAFKSAVDDAGNYHGLVSLCRTAVTTSKSGGDFIEAEKAQAAKAKAFPLKTYLKRIASAKDTMALMEVRNAIDARLKELKPAKVKQMLAEAKQTNAKHNVIKIKQPMRKLRKAA